ncbi:uncharacterized protein LOC110457697 [Mizuhopecten yessoensis]|uniref:uncharacterized protein LOC110457697 n=1 Tax=Mizuhopecten yessoensis TaxID=6573 RepID=UPI000B45AB5A|nr:uncharacterized protein LOC110457697 [Mizuhopecten yessoensis]XP_021364737.1 uncharacterized protein LOC110457697 [Mizuhopecten yessoensis]XP_021364738.1 uncharacterized protein LOC110457697 [Mizuhopecten yessoensis]
MGNTCSEVLTSVVVLPITAGNYRRRQNGSRYYDGTLSSIVFFLIFLAVISILTFSKDIDIGRHRRLGFVLVLLAVIMIFGMVACAVLGCFIRIYGLDSVVLRRQERSVTKLQLIFLWIFGIVSGLFPAFHAGQQFQCHVFSPYINGEAGFFWDSRVVFNVIMMFYLLTEMVFVTYFVQFQLKHSTTARYVLFTLACANISEWLHSIIIDDFSENILYNYFGNKSDIPACMQNETIGMLLDKSKPILGPCLLEFCLLSTTMLFEMWSPNTLQTSSAETFSGDDSRTYQDNVESLNETELSQLLGNTTTYHETSVSRNVITRTVYHLVVLVLSIVITIGNVIGYVLWVMHPGSSQMRLAMEQFSLAEYATTIGAIFIGFYCLVHYCTPDREPKPLKVREYVYLSSAFALIMMAVSEILTGNLLSDSTSELTMTSHILGIVQVYLQVVFLLHANRCQKSNPHLHIHVLDCVLIFLTVININYWIVDSFINTSFPDIRNVEQDVLGSTLWNLHHRILLPAGVFFRFSSVLELFTTLKVYSTV